MTTQYIIVNRYDGELYNGLNIKRFYDTPGQAYGIVQKQHRRRDLLTILAVELGANPTVQQVAKYSGFTSKEFETEVAAFRKRQTRQLKSLLKDQREYQRKHSDDKWYDKWLLSEIEEKKTTIAMLESLRYEDLVYK